MGGGPAGAAAGRLLASWGHDVLLLERGSDAARGLAESIPPSTHKLLDQIGVADAIDRAGFFRTRGNTVWWGSRERRVEAFGGEQGALGYQVFRPDFDRVLLASAEAAGADVRRAHVRHVALDAPAAARVDYEEHGTAATIDARFVLDCSGRAGIVARRFRVAEPGYRTCALVGVWSRSDAAEWGLPDLTHTAVETFADGWAWSVPTCGSTRHIGVMAAQAFSDDDHARTLAAAYQRGLAKTTEIAALVKGAVLERLWACDASLYASTAYAGPRHLLVGDAGSFIDPLSSFGVKKALASGWMAAVAIHTALTCPDRAAIALEYFSDWERGVYASHLRRTREFARAAVSQHPDPYWQLRADAGTEPAIADEADAAWTRDPAVRRVFESFRTAPGISLALSATARMEQRPVIRGHEIVLEPALPGGMRFVANVDLLQLAQIAPHHTQVPDVFDDYCRRCPPVPLPSVVGGLSLLVARGILHERA